MIDKITAFRFEIVTLTTVLGLIILPTTSGQSVLEPITVAQSIANNAPSPAQQYQKYNLNADMVASAITPTIRKKRWPKSITLSHQGQNKNLNIQYTIDNSLQQSAQKLLQRYNPDYAVITIIDPDDGRILAMTDSTRDSSSLGHLSFPNTFPAASISKIITAAAMLDRKTTNSNSKVAFNGKGTTLYKNQVFKHKNTRYTRYMSFAESFGKSVNAVFGRYGVRMGGETYLDYAKKLGFNGEFNSDIEFDNGVIELDTENNWEIAESASGYTRRNTLSPLHAATLGALAINGGKLVTPHVVDYIVDDNQQLFYLGSEHIDAPVEVLEPRTAKQLQDLMQATTKSGSARKSFRRFHTGDMAKVKVGGKTGSLTGYHPKGRYDWFVGYAEQGDKKLAYAILCINKDKWYVKSATLARLLIEDYFTRADADDPLPTTIAQADLSNTNR